MAKIFFGLMLACLLPFSSIAQDTARVRNQAKMVSRAFLKGDYNAVLDSTYPTVMTNFGGRQKMLDVLKKSIDMVKAQGMTFESVEVGSPGKFYKAGTEIDCLLPQTMTIKTANGKVVNHSYLLAISKDHGHKWYFTDLNENSIKRLHQMLPNISKEMPIPELIKPTFYSN